MISEHKVKSFFTAPTAFRLSNAKDPKGEFVRKYDLSCLNAIYLAGERADPDTIVWTQEMTGKPVYDHWWQTETGWTIAGNPVGIEAMPVKLGSPTVPMPGYEIEILDEGGHPMKPGELGAIAINCRCRRAPAEPVERRRAVQEILPVAFPRLLRDRRCGHDRRGRLCLHHGPHR